MDVTKWDARCSACGEVHVITIGDGHGTGDTIKLAHTTGRKACGEYAEHELVAPLHGLA